MSLAYRIAGLYASNSGLGDVSVCSFNAPSSQNFTSLAGETGYAFTLNKRTAGGAVATIIPTINNWRRQINSLVLTEGPAYTINSLVVIANGVGVLATINGSSGPFNIPAGANDFRFDSIPASAFGYSSAGIPTQTTVRFKQVRTLGTGSDTIQSHYSYTRSSDTAQQSISFDPANTTITNATTSATAFTYTGTAPVDRTGIAFDIMMLGTYVGSSKEVYIAYGDSNTMGVGNNTFQINGGGYFLRAMAEMDAACINMAIGGETAVVPFTDSRLTYWNRYATRGIALYGSNDMGASGTDIPAATMLARMEALRVNMLTAANTKIKKVAAFKCLRRTTGTFTSEAGQTYNAGQGPGGNVDIYNTSLDGSAFDRVIALSDTYGEVDSFKWRAPPQITGEGLHLNNAGHIIGGAQTAIELPLMG